MGSSERGEGGYLRWIERCTEEQRKPVGGAQSLRIRHRSPGAVVTVCGAPCSLPLSSMAGARRSCTPLLLLRHAPPRTSSSQSLLQLPAAPGKSLTPLGWMLQLLLLQSLVGLCPWHLVRALLPCRFSKAAHALCIPSCSQPVDPATPPCDATHPPHQGSSAVCGALKGSL